MARPFDLEGFKLAESTSAYGRLFSERVNLNLATGSSP